MHPAFQIVPVVLLRILQRVDLFDHGFIGSAEHIPVKLILQQTGSRQNLAQQIGLVHMVQYVGGFPEIMPALQIKGKKKEGKDHKPDDADQRDICACIACDM